jgi:hypothetical protein
MIWATVGSIASSWRSACLLTLARPIRSARAANAPVRLKIVAVSLGSTTYWTLSEIPRTKQHDELRDWVGDDYDPDAFSIEDVNRRLLPLRRRRGSTSRDWVPAR